LTGPYALYGHEILRGIQLGMDIFNRSEGTQDLELAIRNTYGTVEDTIAGLEELVNNEKVMAIIGPLASIPATAAVKKAQELGVPIISLTQKAGITGEGDMVFRNFLTPSREVEAILNRAIEEMGINRFGIFYPDNAYGRFLMNAFWDRVEEMGGTITAVEAYNPDETDFATGIKKMVGLHHPRPESVTRMLEEMKMMEAAREIVLLGLDRIYNIGERTYSEGYVEEDILKDLDKSLELGPLNLTEGLILSEVQLPDSIEELYETKDETLEEEEEEEPEPIVDFDAVFIPDSYQQIALIAPQFPFYNVFNVPFLGTSIWQSEELIETTGSYVQGAIFPSGFYIDDDSEDIGEFVESFRENFKSDPGVLAANGYDTMMFIRDILENNTIKTRTDLQQKMYENDTFYGVTGKISFDDQGEVEKDPFLLTIYGRRLHLLQ
jgi:ABC-type branched-subunit amino acid transport system substrate-binding protein